MFKVLTPILMLLVSAGLLLTYVKPTFETIRGIQDETVEYVDAIEKATELQNQINRLATKVNSFNPSDLERLEAFLPDTVDEVSLMLDVDAMAEARDLTLTDIALDDSVELQVRTVQVDSTLDSSDPSDDPASTDFIAAAPKEVSFLPVDISFSVTGTYEDLKSFLTDIEQSLAFLDIMRLSFSPSEGDLLTFRVTIRAYSFNSTSGTSF